VVEQRLSPLVFRGFCIAFWEEPDFMDWGSFKIHGLDLRHIPSVEIFCNFIEQNTSGLIFD
jgi:hypothetical protein